ncbi:hypothetical protein BU26DRAFT_271361 [Trematosphaeria pertusa]|uniref:Uncharacterized protein n=1 Tax=Trematosphaeria pertusa TaxID=390896 RepID=A0A6A6IK93_9PLEO|nr:uncharacterized protein BU26DRAFT_271361 [Trematosphaeria pertusa]KAF2250851.1 hypothetical protein BU26DRAFT_271361 [Trematosphaeria pertusa]
MSPSSTLHSALLAICLRLSTLVYIQTHSPRIKTFSPQSTPRILILLLHVHPATSTCSLPNGTAPDDEASAPYSSDPTNPLSTICRHTQWANPPGSDIAFGSTQNERLPTGLCHNRGFSTTPGEEQRPWIRYYRVYCTHGD